MNMVMKLFRYTLIAWFSCCTLLAAGVVTAKERNLSEYTVKAAFLYNFSRFTQWPEMATPNGHFNVCVIGNNPFGDALQNIAGKEVHGRTLTIVKYRAENLSKCHIVFFSKQTSNRIAGLIHRVSKLPVLTVSDMEGFADKGGIIELQIVDNKIRFYINIDAANEAGLTISSGLLRLAGKIKISREGGAQ